MKSLIAALLLLTAPAWAGPVGEAHRTATEPTAALRDAQHRESVRVTIWYPAAANAKERLIVIGPPKNPYFKVGAAAPDAAFAAEAGRFPVILLSHGADQAARYMGWFGIALARAGYVAVAVDHPGNNATDEPTIAGALFWWDRAEDLRAALAAVAADPVIGPHIDLQRVGAAGYSMGGLAALMTVGARLDRERQGSFCRLVPDSIDCKPVPEPRQPWDDHSLPEVRAAFTIAPAVERDLAPASLSRIHVPVAILLGDKDITAAPETNGLAAAQLIPNAQLTRLPKVAHYDFLPVCTAAGRAAVPQCHIAAPQAETHAATIAAAVKFFDAVLAR